MLVFTTPLALLAMTIDPGALDNWIRANACCWFVDAVKLGSSAIRMNNDDVGNSCATFGNVSAPAVASVAVPSGSVPTTRPSEPVDVLCTANVIPDVYTMLSFAVAVE